MHRLILMIFINVTCTQDIGEYEQEYDIIKSMENIDLYFKDIKEDHESLELKKVFDILLITYVESSIEEILVIEKRDKEHEELS